MAKTVLIGIGNPGARYENTFHNVGMLFVDWLGTSHAVRWQSYKNFRYAALPDQADVILAKTDTFMNESGLAVKELVKHLKLEKERLVIAHDDTDIELGRFKLRSGGGTGGHHGVESILEVVGEQEMWRLKLGARPARFIGQPHIKSENFVLSRIGAEENALLYETAFPEAETELGRLLDGKIAAATE